MTSTTHTVTGHIHRPHRTHTTKDVDGAKYGKLHTYEFISVLSICVCEWAQYKGREYNRRRARVSANQSQRLEGSTFHNTHKRKHTLIKSTPSAHTHPMQPTRSPAARRHVKWLYEIPHRELLNRLAFLLIFFLTSYVQSQVARRKPPSSKFEHMTRNYVNRRV